MVELERQEPLSFVLLKKNWGVGRLQTSLSVLEIEPASDMF
jgi:hypothetical protein